MGRLNLIYLWVIRLLLSYNCIKTSLKCLYGSWHYVLKSFRKICVENLLRYENLKIISNFTPNAYKTQCVQISKTRFAAKQHRSSLYWACKSTLYSSPISLYLFQNGYLSAISHTLSNFHFSYQIHLL